MSSSGHTSPADFWNHDDTLLMWRTWLRHGPVCRPKTHRNHPELSWKSTTCVGFVPGPAPPRTGAWTISATCAVAPIFPDFQRTKRPARFHVTIIPLLIGNANICFYDGVFTTKDTGGKPQPKNELPQENTETAKKNKNHKFLSMCSLRSFAAIILAAWRRSCP
jgi:hypothetical protein